MIKKNIITFLMAFCIAKEGRHEMMEFMPCMEEICGPVATCAFLDYGKIDGMIQNEEMFLSDQASPNLVGRCIPAFRMIEEEIVKQKKDNSNPLDGVHQVMAENKITEKLF